MYDQPSTKVLALSEVPPPIGLSLQIVRDPKTASRSRVLVSTNFNAQDSISETECFVLFPYILKTKQVNLISAVKIDMGGARAQYRMEEVFAHDMHDISRVRSSRDHRILAAYHRLGLRLDVGHYTYRYLVTLLHVACCMLRVRLMTLDTRQSRV